MPNRRRRKLSTAMSAVAALAVASPCAYFLVYESTESPKPPQHHEFKQAAVVTDLPGELMGALTQGLSQFGINLPPVPALSGTSATGAGATSPGLGLGSPSLGTSGLGTGGLGTSGLTGTGLTSPGLTSPGLGTGLTTGAATPGLTTPSTALTPTLPTTPGAAAATTPNPALTSPAGVAPGMGSPIAAPSEVPISDPGADGTYPILGDPSGLGGGGLGASPAASGGGGGGGGGLINDLMQAANSLGAGQAIDLLKGLVMPAIMQQVHGGAGAAAAAPGAALSGCGGPAGGGCPAGCRAPGCGGYSGHRDRRDARCRRPADRRGARCRGAADRRGSGDSRGCGSAADRSGCRGGSGCDGSGCGGSGRGGAGGSADPAHVEPSKTFNTCYLTAPQSHISAVPSNVRSWGFSRPIYRVAS